MKASGTEDKPTPGEVDVKPEKRAYAPPVLRVYGSLRNLTQKGKGSGADGGPAAKNKVSDRQAKENIVRIGAHPLGFGLYLFDYKPAYRASCGAQRQFGVMADEVEAIMPQAVSVHADGYRMVDYAMLGIEHGIQ